MVPLLAPALFGAARLGMGMAASMAGTTVAQTVQQVADTSVQSKYRDYDIGQFARQVRDIGGSLKEFREAVTGVTKGLGVSMTENAQAMKTALKYGAEQGGATAVRTSGQSAQDSLVFAVTNGLNRQLVNSVKEAMGQAGIVGSNSSYSSTSQQFERMFSEFASMGKMGLRTEAGLQNTASYVSQQASRGVTGINPAEFAKVQAMASLAAQQPGQAALNTVAPNAYRKLDAAFANVGLHNIGGVMPGFTAAAGEEIVRQKAAEDAATKRRDAFDARIKTATDPAEKARLTERRDAENNNIVNAQRQRSNMEDWQNSGAFGAAYAIQNSGPEFQANLLKKQLATYGWDPKQDEKTQRLRIQAATNNEFGGVIGGDGQRMTTMEVEALLKTEAQRETIEKKQRAADSFRDSAAGMELASGRQNVSKEAAREYAINQIDPSSGLFREPFKKEIDERLREKEVASDDAEMAAGTRTSRRTEHEINQAAQTKWEKLTRARQLSVVGTMVQSGEIRGDTGPGAVRMTTQDYSKAQAEMAGVGAAGDKKEVDAAVEKLYKTRKLDSGQLELLQTRSREWNKGGSLYADKLAEMRKVDPNLAEDSEEFQNAILNSRKQDVTDLRTKGTVGGESYFLKDGKAVKDSDKNWWERVTTGIPWIGPTEIEGKANKDKLKGGSGGGIEDAAEATVELTTAIENLTKVITPFLTGLVKGTTGLIEGITPGVAFGGAVFSGNSARLVGERGPELFLPGRAFGGVVSKNKAYLVGERGPELFRPPTDGTILTNAVTTNISNQLLSGNLDAFLSNMHSGQKTFFMTAAERASKGAFGNSSESSLMQDFERAWYAQQGARADSGPAAEDANGPVNSPVKTTQQDAHAGRDAAANSAARAEIGGLRLADLPSDAEIRRLERIESRASAGPNQGVGRMVAAMEGGGNYGAYGAISGRDTNFGLFQFNVQAGVADKFVREGGFSDRFGGAQAGTEEFAAAWAEQANNADFQKAQWDFAQKNYLQSAIDNIRGVGEKQSLSPENNYFDLQNRSDAVKELIFSAAIQGPAVAKDLASRTISQLGPNWKDEEFIDAFQEIRKQDILDKESGHFRGTSQSVSETIANGRYETERQLAHYLLAQEQSGKTPVDRKAGGGLVSQNRPTVVGEKGPELLLPGASASVLSNTMTTRLAAALGGDDGQGSSGKTKDQRVIVQFVAPDGSSAGSATIGFGQEDQFIKIAIGESWKL